jgi:RNA polymerase-binding protein DksA
VAKKTSKTETSKSKSKPKPAKEVKAKPALAVKVAKPAPKPVLRPAPKPDKHEAEAPALTEADLRKVKTGLSRKDLENYRDLLLAKRAEILGDVESLETDARNNSGGNLSNMPLHMADIGTDNYDQEFTLGLVESERKLLVEINEALLRIKAGTFGVCIEKGIPIGRPRLDIKPWAKYCIEVARDMERRGRAG